MMPTVDEILMGTRMGPRQSVANMDVIPLLADEGFEDPFFAPPDYEATTVGYGEVRVRNDHDEPTIVPPGTGFVTKESAQDHAVTGGTLVNGKTTKTIPNSCCIQEDQPGLITRGAEMIMLPAPVRVQAIKTRRSSEYSRLWGHLQAWKKQFGLTGRGNLADYLTAFKRELDEFVAEFELIPGQVGAIILISGKVVGIERSPNGAFWGRLWEPLVRGCYGGLSLQVARAGGPTGRLPLEPEEGTLEGIRKALNEANKLEDMQVGKVISVARRHSLSVGSAEARFPRDKVEMVTAESPRLVGQVVIHEDRPVYASLCSA